MDVYGYASINFVLFDVFISQVLPGTVGNMHLMLEGDPSVALLPGPPDAINSDQADGAGRHCEQMGFNLLISGSFLMTLEAMWKFSEIRQ